MTNGELASVLDRKLKMAGRSYIPFPLHAKQVAFLGLPQLEALYGGAAGGGKTEAELADCLQYVHHKHYRALILRRSYPELSKPGAIMDRALQWMGREFWSATDKRFTFPSGAVIQFGYVAGQADLAQYKSAQFHRVYIDELTEWAEPDYVFLFSRIRKTVGDPIPLAMRAGTNPDGVGAEWVRIRFGIEEGQTPQGPIHQGEDRVFLPARAEDNPSLDLEPYDKALRQLGDAKYQQLRWGKWVRDGEGLVYGAFLDSRNVIAKAPECPYKILSQDYGTTAQTSWTLLGYRDNDPRVYILKSWKLAGIIPSRNAEIVEDLERVWKFASIVGDVGGLGKAYAEEARRRFMLPIEAADKNNKRGYIELFNGELERGRILIVNGEGECADLVHEMKTLPWKPHSNRAEEAPGFENHCTDGALYGWRRASAYAAKELRPEPKTPEEAKRRELDEFFAKDAAVQKAAREREWWDDGTSMLSGSAFDDD